MQTQSKKNTKLFVLFSVSLSFYLSVSGDAERSKARALSLSLFADKRFCGDFLWAQKTEKVFVISRTRNKQKDKKNAPRAGVRVRNSPLKTCALSLLTRDFEREREREKRACYLKLTFVMLKMLYYSFYIYRRFSI